MNDLPALDPATHALLRCFFDDYLIRSIGISIGSDIRNDAVSQVDIHFFREVGNDATAYLVSFKLLDRASDAYRYLRSISSQNTNFQVQAAEAGQGLGSDALARKVRNFIAAIRERVEKIHKEQSILGTQPLGKTFILNNKARFKVVADDGEGQLTIEIMGQQGGREARLGMNDLLDGLYTGMIAEE